jgi:hypothetical protein
MNRLDETGLVPFDVPDSRADLLLEWVLVETQWRRPTRLELRFDTQPVALLGRRSLASPWLVAAPGHDWQVWTTFGFGNQYSSSRLVDVSIARRVGGRDVLCAQREIRPVDVMPWDVSLAEGARLSQGHQGLRADGVIRLQGEQLSLSASLMERPRRVTGRPAYRVQLAGIHDAEACIALASLVAVLFMRR